MSGFEALGMASSVLQVISFGLETAGLCKAIYTGVETPDGKLVEKSTAMMGATSRMMAYTHALPSNNLGDGQLVEAARKCNDTANKLKQEVDKLGSGGAKGNFFRTTSAALKYRWKRSMLQKLEGDLGDWKATMELHILVDLLNKTDVMELLQKQQFGVTSTSIKQLASDFANGNRDLQEFINQEHEQTRAHTTTQAARLGASLRGHITNEATTAQAQSFSESQRQTLRASTKYPGMNERWNQITEPHLKTYEWVLDDSAGTQLSRYQERWPGEDEGVSEDEDGCRHDPWPRFVEWLESGNQTRWYWISGKPGSGKSTLFKFLSEHRETQRYLQRWKPSVCILRHSFWKPGSEMQKSIRGLWCCLSHQMMMLNNELPDMILKGNPLARQKTEHHDWGPTEMKNLCLGLLSAHETPYCIFVDGLDEVGDSDGADALLKALQDIQDTLGERVKICVSSRLEHRFSRSIGRSLELQLHLLTEKDMRAYALDSLRGNLPQSGRHQVRVVFTLERILLAKAEGVFIWLVLALRSVIQGLKNGDYEDEIILRTEQLPADINDLYQEMWNRLNQDNAIYQADARKILSYMVHKQQLLREVGPNSTALVELAFFLDMASAQKVLEGKHCLDREELTNMHDNAFRMVNVRSAGLLQCHTHDAPLKFHPLKKPSHYYSGYAARQQDYPLVIASGEDQKVAMQSTVSFIHRTAYDYLTTTSRGMEIVGHNERLRGVVALNMARSALAYMRCVDTSEPDKPWIGVHEWQTEIWLPFMAVAMRDEDEKVVQATTKLLDLATHAFQTSLEHSKHTTTTAPLGSHLINYPSLLTYATQSSNPPDLTRAVIWNIRNRNYDRRNGIYPERLGVPYEGTNDDESLAFRSLPETLRRCMTFGLQTTLRLPLSFRIGVHSYVCHCLTIMELLFLKLVHALWHPVPGIDFLTVKHIIECIIALHPSIEDMKSTIPLLRVISDFGGVRYDALVPPIDSAPFINKIEQPRKDDYINRQFYSPPGRGWPDKLRVAFLFEANLSYAVSKAVNMLTSQSTSYDEAFGDFSPLQALMDLQAQSVCPSAAVLYLIDHDRDPLPSRRSMAFSCDFGTSGDDIFLQEAGLANDEKAELILGQMNKFLDEPSHIEKGEAMSGGQIFEHLVRTKPWFCMAEDADGEVVPEDVGYPGQGSFSDLWLMGQVHCVVLR